jgi:hypothetical protein
VNLFGGCTEKTNWCALEATEASVVAALDAGLSEVADEGR